MSETITVVIPVFNNQPTLGETCRQVVEVHQSSFGGFALEVIFVNDGSTDGSWDELVLLKERYGEQVTLINLSRNFGQAGALFAGFSNAKGDAVICVSADMQDPISLMAKMVAYWKNNTEIVICYRESRNDGQLARMLSRYAYSVARLTYPELPRGGFDYWLMSRRVCKMLCSFRGRHNFVQGYLLSVGFSKAFIPYTRVKRKVGSTGYKFGQKLKMVVDFLVDSSLPIRFMSGLGVLFSLCGCAYSLIIAYAWFVQKTPFSGWAPLMVITMLIGGMLMIMLGVIGEYVWRIYDNSREFPLYIIDKSLTTKPEDSSLPKP